MFGEGENRMSSYNSSSGKSYTLGARLGYGGEGEVYEIQGDDTKVAKIYKNQKFKSEAERSTMERKLKAMIHMNIPVYVDGKLRLAWPQDILYQNGSLVGFIMPKISFRKKIMDIQRVESAQKIYPKYTWKYSVQYAYNFAWVVKYVHEHNIVIGDFNFNNFYADTSSGAVVLIDCDSFDIKDPVTNEHFACTVALPELVAPELQNVGNLKKGTFTKETDEFSLAIHLFRLLMRNEDPFGGVITSGRSVSSIPANMAIINGECPYVRNVANKEVPARAPSLDVLTPELQQLFQRTFNYDIKNCKSRIQRRATAAEWCRALAVLGAAEPNPNLVTCSKNRYHVYPKHNTSCPWCRCEQYIKTSQTPTPTPQPSQQNTYTYTYTQSYTSSGTTTQNSQSSTSSRTTQRSQSSTSSNSYASRTRSPYLFYIVLIACGLASGFAFGGLTSHFIVARFGISVTVCTILLSIVGVIAGGLLAHYFEDDYIFAEHMIPWLFLGIVALVIPVLLALAISVVIGIIIKLFGIIAGVVVAIFGAIAGLVLGLLKILAAIVCIGAICSGS